MGKVSESITEHIPLARSSLAEIPQSQAGEAQPPPAADNREEGPGESSFCDTLRSRYFPGPGLQADHRPESFES